MNVGKKRAGHRVLVKILMIVFDAVAVNMAYFLALILRFYVKFSFNSGAEQYVPIFWKTAPLFAVACVAVFYVFRLYNTMWEFGGLQDLNRILMSCAVTAVIQVALTTLLFGKMPLTYYILGPMIQFVLIAGSRFSYKFYLMERNQHRSQRNATVNAMVIGIEGIGKFARDQVNASETLRAACLVDITDDSLNRYINNVPVIGLSGIKKALKEKRIGHVVIAESRLTEVQVGEIKAACAEREIEVEDFVEYLQNNNDSLVPVTKSANAEGARVIPFSPPDISDKEINEVKLALKSGWITTGPRTKLLERRLAAYIETGKTDIDCTTEETVKKYSNRVACLNSATAAEELNLRILGVGPGDEVIVPAYSYTASASAAIHCGAKVVFVDIQKDGDPITHMPEMDYEKLEQAITPKTKAIVSVDLGGIVCDYDRIFEIVERKKALFTPFDDHSNPLADLSSRIQKAIGHVAVVADCAHSLGASRVVGGKKKYCGAIADFTSFSFHAVKNFTTAEGGASTWLQLDGIDDAEIYKFYQLLSLHGQNKDALAKTKIGAWEYDIIGPWYKCNMTDIMAAIGLRQLDRYLGMLERRVQMMKKYDAVCAELGISHMIHHVEGMDSSNHLYLIRVPGIDVEQRNEIIEKMAEHGVATNVHYKPMPMMTAYKILGWNIKDFPNSYDYYHNLITLPFHTLLSDDDVDYVCETLRVAVDQSRMSDA